MTTAVLAEIAPAKRMGRKEAALFLTAMGFPISEKTLCNMASNENRGSGRNSGGPAFYKTNWKTVFYLETDLLAWASVRIRRVG